MIVVLAWGMRNRNHFAVEHLRLADVFGGESAPGEDDRGVYEVDAVFVEFCWRLASSHVNSVATLRSYGKPRTTTC